MPVTYTIIFATQRRRKVFDAQETRTVFMRILDRTAAGQGVTIPHARIRPDGVILECCLPEGKDPESFAAAVKQATSAPIRLEFRRFSRMPALWTRQTWARVGPIAEQDEKEIRRFFDMQKSR